MELRKSLKGALGERSSETIGASARDSSGELSLNSSDAGTETFDRDVALSMVANEQDALNEIEDAIDRIFDGSFGICQETKKPIKKNRLKAVPFTRFSLEGQDLFEKRRKFVMADQALEHSQVFPILLLEWMNNKKSI